MNQEKIDELEFELNYLDEEIQANSENFQETEKGREIIKRINEILSLLP